MMSYLKRCSIGSSPEADSSGEVCKIRDGMPAEMHRRRVTICKKVNQEKASLKWNRMFWNRKKTPPATPADPRDHHYVFAHILVREVCAQDPIRFFALVASPEQKDFVAWLWEMTAKQVGRPITEFDPGQLEVNTFRVNDAPAILLKMPVPIAAAEAHMVGVILTGLPQDEEPESKGSFRYFTLEHGVNLDDTIRTVFCEWNEGSHLNFGDGPPPTVEAFASAIEARL